MIESVNEFHIMYEKAKIWEKTKFFGIPMWKLPFDAFIIAELIHEVRPRFIIETGTGHGGSAMFYASICELLGEGRIITIDIDGSKKESNEWGKFEWEDRITFLHGSSTNPLILEKVHNIVNKAKKNIVLLDSYHTMDHVEKEMAFYSEFVSVGSYMIVEDTHANGHPVPWQWGDGPYEAVENWMKYHGNEWEYAKECERHIMTFNPRGYLRRTS